MICVRIAQISDPELLSASVSSFHSDICWRRASADGGNGAARDSEESFKVLTIPELLRALK